LLQSGRPDDQLIITFSNCQEMEGDMKRSDSLSKRSSFFWAFILNRRKPPIKWAGPLPADCAPTISVVIPTLNEADNLPRVLPKIPDWVDEVLLVDGCSTDNTVGVARELRPDIHIVMQEGCGKGAALRSGFAVATGDIIVMLDADGSTDPAEIPAFVGALMAGADFAKGSRFAQGAGTADMPRYRKFGNWVFVKLVRLFFGGQYSDLCYGYNAFWKDVLPQLELDGDGFEIETIMNVRALRAGLKISEVPSFEAERVYGAGRLRAIPDGWRVLKAIFREFRQQALQRPRHARSPEEFQTGNSSGISESAAVGKIQSV
jgi:glycosyltransferase involved in cell wall biosynthesis